MGYTYIKTKTFLHEQRFGFLLNAHYRHISHNIIYYGKNFKLKL